MLQRSILILHPWIVPIRDGLSDCLGKQIGFTGFSLWLTVADEAEADRVFAALAEGGEVRMALAKTFFASTFGMVTDRFGVGWMVIAPLPR